MTCNGCITFVKNKLLMNPDIINAELSLPDAASLTMKRHLNVYELQEVIGVESKYKIIEDSNYLTNHERNVSRFNEWLKTYKPLLLVTLFITGTSFLSAYDIDSINGMLWMQNFMAGFFLVFSFFKLFNLKGFAESYAMYDVLAKRLPLYGYVYPFLELALGVAYFTGFNPIITNGITVALMGFSSIGVLQSVLNKRKIRCACLGDVFDLPMSTITIIEDLVMITMAAGHFIYLII